MFVENTFQKFRAINNSEKNAPLALYSLYLKFAESVTFKNVKESVWNITGILLGYAVLNKGTSELILNQNFQNSHLKTFCKLLWLLC